jgi:hypothetical protein
MGLEFDEVKKLVVGTWDIDKDATISKGKLDEYQAKDVAAFNGYIKVTQKEFKFLGGSGKEPSYKYLLRFSDKYYIFNTDKMVDGKPHKEADVEVLDDNTIIYTDYGFPYSLYLVRRS